MRKLRMTGIAGVVLAMALSANGEQPADPKANALKLFETYVSLEHGYDPKVADLYSDTALIKNRRTYPSGDVKVLRIPAEKYKSLIREAMPLAMAKGDRSIYSEVTYAEEGDRVRIKATRYSELKKYSSPLSLLVGPGSGKSWLIFEEISETRP